jgi:hypothetical protein
MGFGVSLVVGPLAVWALPWDRAGGQRATDACNCTVPGLGVLQLPPT